MMIKILTDDCGYTKAQIVIMAVSNFFWLCLGEARGRELLDKAMSSKEVSNDTDN